MTSKLEGVLTVVKAVVELVVSIIVVVAVVAIVVVVIVDTDVFWARERHEVTKGARRKLKNFHSDPNTDRDSIFLSKDGKKFQERYVYVRYSYIFPFV